MSATDHDKDEVLARFADDTSYRTMPSLSGEFASHLETVVNAAADHADLRRYLLM